MRRDISRTSPLDVRSLSRLFTNKLATDGLRLSHKKERGFLLFLGNVIINYTELISIMLIRRIIFRAYSVFYCTQEPFLVYRQQACQNIIVPVIQIHVRIK